MRRVCLLVLAFIFVFSIDRPASADRGFPLALMRAVKPLQSQQRDGTWFAVCTTWSTLVGTKPRTVWVTAYHCIADDHGMPLTETVFAVDGTRVSIGAGDPIRDIVILEQGPRPSLVLVLAANTPTPLVPVWAAGFPYGSPWAHGVAGVVSCSEDEDGLAGYAMPLTFGMSGAPVITQDGLVIGMIQRHRCAPLQMGAWCAFTRGATLATLRMVLAGVA